MEINGPATHAVSNEAKSELLEVSKTWQHKGDNSQYATIRQLEGNEVRCNALQTWAHELEGVFSFHEGAKDALQAAEINAFSEASTAPGTVVL